MWKLLKKNKSGSENENTQGIYKILLMLVWQLNVKIEAHN